jgi:hypothetical protein
MAIVLFDGDPLSWEVVFAAFIAGLFIGLIFVVATRWTVNRELSRIVIQVNDDEKVLKESFANHFEDTKGIRGKLVLTDRKLIFKSMIRNIHIEPVQEVFELDQLEKVSKTKMLKLIPNGLTIRLHNNTTEKFVVEDADEWVKILHQRTGQFAS